MTIGDLSPAAERSLRGIVDRMLPADDFPSGWESGLDRFLDGILRTEPAARLDWIAPGIAALDAEAGLRAEGMTFADLGEAEQDDLLAALASGTSRAAWPMPAQDFVDLFARLCAQGFYGDPGNGGNRDAVSWDMVGYRQLAPGVAWPATEPATGPTVTIGGLRPRYDAIVIGAGAGGGIAACVLAEAGMTVLLVERGSALSSDELRLDHLRSERSVTGYPTKTGGSATGDPRVILDGSNEKTVYPPDSRWSANAMTVGGGTRVYGAQAWRFCPEDFRMASIYGVPEGSTLADWPIDYDELEPWYDRAEWELGVSGAAGGDRYAGARTRDYPMPPVERNPGAQILADAADRLGLLTGPVPLLINSVQRDGRPACVLCGACVGFACQAAAKNGSQNTVIPRALATGRCDLLTGVQAERVLANGDGRATGVAVVTEVDGEIVRRDVTADRIVVAAGAIESARLLLNSATLTEPTGLGNARDQVGRNLQAHVYAGAIGLFDEVVRDSTGPGPSVATNDFRHGNPGLVGGGMLANDFVPTPLNVWDTLTGLGAIERFGAASKLGMRRLWSRMQMIFGPLQEVPNADSRVQVDAEVRDRFGIRVAKLSGDIHPEDRRGARFLADRAEEWLLETGAHTVFRTTADDRPAGPSGGQHQAGTLRMGEDPETSATDRWGRVWGHDNVLIADGSVHVTNGGVNPVLTIAALAYRNADRMAEDWLAGR
jgi:choline dehydrogenase-like flavoprotein